MMKHIAIIAILLVMAISFGQHAQLNPAISGGATHETVVKPIIVGPEEIVFDYTIHNCRDVSNIPDLPARAYIDEDNNVQLISTHYTARRMVGRTLDTIVPQCPIVSGSIFNDDPAAYADNEWLASFYTEDGHTIYALQHNEFQGHHRPELCRSGNYFACWYNSITLAVSKTAGRTFYNVGLAPKHVVAPFPEPYVPEAGPYGYMSPSNMFEGPGDYIYAFFKVDQMNGEDQWTCLMRTHDVSVASTWRAWDGEGFNLEFSNPYVDTKAADLCAPISYDQIGGMHESVTYNTYLNKYVLVGTTGMTIEGEIVWGFFYSYSDDLINWSPRELLLEVEFMQTWVTGDENPRTYPSLIDPDSKGRIFQYSDQNAYLYYTVHNFDTGDSLDRDLVRVPIKFVDISVDAPALEFNLSGTVPDNMSTAIVGYRANLECGGCTGALDMSLYSVEYYESGETTNRVTNPVFNAGDLGWFWWGSEPGVQDLVPSDLTETNMLNVDVDKTQWAALNSSSFPVTAGEHYTLTFTARVRELADYTGYFALMFFDSDGLETHREYIHYAVND